jgi:hypothetical protein
VGVGDATASGVIPLGPSLWLSADQGATVASGQVSSWRDQSGNQNDATMTVASRQPSLVRATLNGHDVLHFSGAQSLELTRFEQPEVFSVFVVGRNSMPGDTFSMILGPGGNSPNNQLRWEDGGNTLIVGTGNDLPATTIAIGNTRVYHLLSVRFDGSQLGIHRDGQLVDDTPLTTDGPWVVAQIGAWYSQYFMIGDLAELVIYDRALSAGELAETNSYLRAKYALP